MADHPRNEQPRPDRPRRAERRERPAGWDRRGAVGQDTDPDLPPWAGPLVYPVKPAGTRLRPPAPADDYEPLEHADPWEGDEPPQWPEEDPRQADPDSTQQQPGRRSGRRAAAARLRKSRRRVLRWCGIAIAVCVVAAGVGTIVTHQSAANLPYVTALQKGEFTSVPNACRTLSPSELSQYLPGTRSTVQSQDGPTLSECTFTVDRRPSFLVLTIRAQSFDPFAAASGDGSASRNALDNFVSDRAQLTQPPKHSPLPKASIMPLTGTGQRAFFAVQLEHTAGIARDVVTVEILERNAIITVSMSGQESGGYGPVAIGTLQADAHAVAGKVLTQVLAQPTA